MIKWKIASYTKIQNRKILLTLTDVKLCEASINDFNMFKEFLILLEKGKDVNINFPKNIQQKIIEGIQHLNWDGLI